MNSLSPSPMSAQLDAVRLSARPDPNAAPSGGNGKLSASDLHKFKQTAQDFEAVFISEMLRPMFENIEPSSPFGGGSGEKIYRDMQIDEYGKAIAKSGGIGLADNVMREMIKMQEGK